MMGRAGSWFVAREAETVEEASRELLRLLPGCEAAPVTWAEYYNASSAVFHRIAKIDVKHRAEALAFAWCDERRALQCFRLDREEEERPKL